MEQHYLVVKNAEEQYSIWAAERALPAGWDAVGEPASKQACLDYIEQHWTNMVPASVRRHAA